MMLFPKFIAISVVLNNFILPSTLYAVAGTPTTLAAIALGLSEFDYEKIHGYILKKEIVDSIFEQFISIPLESIISKWGIHPLRADVIAAGSLILREFMNYFNLKQCIVSAKGLRYGVMLSLDL